MYKLKEGINHCTNEEYHGDKSYLSSSNLKLLLKDVAKFKDEVLDGNRKEIKSSTQNVFDEGTYAHSLILEPETIEKEFAFWHGIRKAGNEFEAFKAANTGKIIMSKSQRHRVEKWVEAYGKRPEAVDLVSGGFPEYSLAGKLHDVDIKVRADYINIDKGYIADVKTTGYSPDVDSFSYVVKSLGYDLSAALYTKMFENYYKRKFDFYFIVLGKKDIACEVYKLSDDSRQAGDLAIMEALKKYKRCLKSGVWTEHVKDDKIEKDNYEILEV